MVMQTQRGQQRIQTLEMVVRGAELADVLSVLLEIDPFGCATAFFIMRDEHMEFAASHGLSPDQRLALQFVLQLPFTGISDLGSRIGAHVRPLISGASEILGAIAFFCENAVSPSESLEVIPIAALAIEQSNLLKELTYRADHDALTGIWNRERLQKEIDRALNAMPRAGAFVSLLYIDLDRYGLINEILGHRVGDQILRLVSDRLRERAGLHVLFARARGDQFLALLENVRSPEQAILLGESLLEILHSPFDIGEHALSVTASIGVCTGLPEEFTSEDLEAAAYLAVGYAKKAGRNRVVAFHSSMASAPPESLERERHLRSALENGEFIVHYQPQIQLATGRIVGIEALVRWNHPVIGFISPATFIPLAEEIGVIDDIGRWVLREAIRFVHGLHAVDGLQHMRIGINVSASQLSRADFSSWVMEEIDAAGVDPNFVELEITESVIMNDFPQVLRQMDILRDNGVQFSIDDFGTGHSSLALLQELPIQRLKIDKTFIHQIADRESRPPLLAYIIQLAHALHVPVIAEGIETEFQAFVLAAMNCEEVQGHHYARAMHPDDMVAMLMRELTPQTAATV